MKRFTFWLKLHSLIMDIHDVGNWIGVRLSFRFHVLFMKAGAYCMDQARNNIPEEYHDQLIDLKEHDPSCGELGCWR